MTPPSAPGADGEIWNADFDSTQTTVLTLVAAAVSDELPGEVADDAAPEPDSSIEFEIEIPDWPADAIEYSAGPVDEAWNAGTALSCASAPTATRRPGGRRPGNPALGPIALAMGISALGSAMAGLIAAWLHQGSANAIMAVGLICVLPALILGTLGRRSRAGRRAATIGRLCGWATPVSLLFILVAAFKSVVDVPFKVLIVVFPLLGYGLVAFLITLIADAMLDAD